MRVGNKVTKSSIKETIRAHVEITSLDESALFNTFSYTLHETNIEDIIRAAIEGTYQTRNLRLKPQMKNSSRKPKRDNPSQRELGALDE